MIPGRADWPQCLVNETVVFGQIGRALFHLQVASALSVTGAVTQVVGEVTERFDSPGFFLFLARIFGSLSTRP